MKLSDIKHEGCHILGVKPTVRVYGVAPPGLGWKALLLLSGDVWSSRSVMISLCACDYRQLRTLKAAALFLDG